MRVFFRHRARACFGSGLKSSMSKTYHESGVIYRIEMHFLWNNQWRTICEKNLRRWWYPSFFGKKQWCIRTYIDYSKTTGPWFIGLWTTSFESSDANLETCCHLLCWELRFLRNQYTQCKWDRCWAVGSPSSFSYHPSNGKWYGPCMAQFYSPSP